MAFTTTSNYAGKAAGFYISAALNQANSLDYLTLMENVKFKSSYPKNGRFSDLVQNSSNVTLLTCRYFSA